LVLVKEVENFLPFLAEGRAVNERWNSVTTKINENLKTNVTPLAVSRRFKLLITGFRAEDNKARYK
jgi:hypothetical protein